MSQSSVDDLVEARREYSAGFVTDVETDTATGPQRGRHSLYLERKDEPEWLTQWRLKRSNNGRNDRARLAPPTLPRGGFSEHFLLFRLVPRMGPGRWMK